MIDLGKYDFRCRNNNPMGRDGKGASGCLLSLPEDVLLIVYFALQALFLVKRLGL
jgi:hypothetical protein